jgi:Flp pilus assembly protein TadG
MRSPIIRRADRTSGSRAGNLRSEAARSQAQPSNERGVTIALVAAAMVGIISMAALSIDIGTLYEAKAQAQRAADAGALTAARIISTSGITGDPNNSASSWQPTCGGAGSTATLAAISIAQAQSNFVAGSAIPAAQVLVTYGAGSAGGSNSDCAGLGQAFAVNPMVTVKVQQTNLPIFFARVFSLVGGNFSSASVSATATAEVFNPSNSGNFASGGEVVPVQPRCVKPWIMPNMDPLNPPFCNPGTCKNFVSTVAGAEGSILNGGISLNGSGGGVIGETFNLAPDCGPTGNCNAIRLPPAPFFVNPPKANAPNVPATTPQPNLQYLPGLAPATSSAAPSCASGPYQQAIAGCDQTTAYQCGVPSPSATNPNQVDLTENPIGAAGDTSTAVQCLTHESSLGSAPSGQDQLVTSSYPFQIQAGTSNPLNITGNISSSNSIVSLPIYDGGALAAGNQPSVTIVGFLQVFINYINTDGSLNVTVMNVAGCGNTVPAGTQPLYGTSPVPIRLITPP